MKRKLTPVVLASALLGLVFNWLFYGNAPGVSIFLFTIVIEMTLIGLTTYYRSLLRFSVQLLMPLALFFSAMLFVRASGFLGFLNTIMTMYILLLMVQLTVWPDRRFKDYTAYNYLVKTALIPLQAFINLVRVMASFVTTKSVKAPPKHQTWPIIRGLLLSIPILLIFLALFSSADPIFKHNIGSIFALHLSANLVGHLLVFAVITTIFIGIYALLFLRSEKDVSLDFDDVVRVKIGNTETFIILGLVLLLFLTFIIIQLRYLFGGNTNIVVDGFTYAEYARRGFFELIFVALLSLGLLLGLAKTTVLHDAAQRLIFKILSCSLIVEVMVVMLSAHKRLVLYEQAYGFTQLRIYSQFFVYWLAVVFVLLLVHIIREERSNILAMRVFVTMVAGLLLINFLNPDALVAHSDIRRFKSTGKIDTHNLASLSDDALPSVVELLNSKDQTVQKSIAADLYWQKLQRGTGYHAWQSYNITRHRSADLLEKYRAQLEADKNFTHPSYIRD